MTLLLELKIVNCRRGLKPLKSAAGCRCHFSARRLSENALFPKLCVMLKKLSSKYQLDVCGNLLSKP
ncbi:MAG: hypothetical protein B1H11_08280 [Desulfobacteraceae bacterium 4484_190.1]|nr:MAG: hypothetical protein B1H11_08280 [Desulfobacteraceae bacterium 4484_190.1]